MDIPTNDVAPIPKATPKLSSVVYKGGAVNAITISFKSGNSYRVWKEEGKEVVVESIEPTRVMFGLGAIISDPLQRDEIIESDRLYRYLVSAGLI